MKHSVRTKDLPTVLTLTTRQEHLREAILEQSFVIRALMRLTQISPEELQEQVDVEKENFKEQFKVK